MNSSILSDTEIFNIIDREITQGDFDPACKLTADQESQGNYDLMISRYFLARIESLKNQPLQLPVPSRHTTMQDQEDKIQSSNRSVALEERKIASANQHLVRYRANLTATKSKETKQKNQNRLINVSGNIILAISSISVISAIMILLGHTIHTLPYLWIIVGTVISLAAPFLFSKVSFSKCIISYQTILTALCICTCFGSTAAGVFLMKKNPPNYHPDQQMASQQVKTMEKSLEISLKPAKTGSSMVTNP